MGGLAGAQLCSGKNSQILADLAGAKFTPGKGLTFFGRVSCINNSYGRHSITCFPARQNFFQITTKRCAAGLARVR